ncbi:ArsR/SmtB family transcription factor [Leifsonia sp. NPDC058230]|uniref:ArsR/SmtB family transcription factor n=1 Tax=Leifsonia sp. NPDC058230 TaxID=3346391 RepID=UPI0036DE5617
MAESAQDAEVDRALRALADANRRSILSTIRETALPVGELAASVGLSQQTTSHHLGVLRDAGLVSESRQGRRHLYAVNSDGFAATRDYLEGFWPGKLAALRDAVESGRKRDHA